MMISVIEYSNIRSLEESETLTALMKVLSLSK